MQVPCNILIGPLYNPGVIGDYAQSEQIKVFMNQSAQTEAFDYDLVYNLEHITHFNQILDGLPDDWLPDLVIWWDPVYQVIPPGIEDCPYPIALIPGDWNLSFLNVLHMSQMVDGVFADARLGPILQQAGISNVHQWAGFAYDASQVYREPERERIYDICFIGNMNPYIHPERSKYLAQVLQLQDRYQLFLKQGVWKDAYRKALNQSRIVLNYTICQVMNMRAYEAPACEALLFIEEDNFEVRDVFEDRVSCVLYNESNLLELLEYYLTHEDQRAAIAAEGYRIVQNYSYERQFERLLVSIPDFLSHLPTQRKAFDYSFEQRQLLALNQISASNRQGASRAAIFLNDLWQDLAQQIKVTDVFRLNAILVMFFPYLNENQEIQQVYSLSLTQLRQGFESAVRLDPLDPVLMYHFGFVCEYLDEHERALWAYSRSIELMAAGHRSELEKHAAFILPFNKSGRGSHQIAFEWEKVSYQTYETGFPRDRAYVRLLSASIWERIGRILLKQSNYEKAWIAFENSQQNFMRASILLELCKLCQHLDKTEQWFELFQAVIKQQPLMISKLIADLTPEQLIQQTELIHKWSCHYLILFPELQKTKLLSEWILAARGQDFDLNWQDLLHLPYSQDLYQMICWILQRFEARIALEPFQPLRKAWSIAWELTNEIPVQMGLEYGIDWNASSETKISESGKLKRIYDRDSDLSLGLCGPDLFPFAFCTEMPDSSHVVDACIAEFPKIYLAVLSQWTHDQITALIHSYEQLFSHSGETLLLVWSPPQCRFSLADLESLMPPDLKASITWLDENLSLPEQAYLLNQSDLILTSPKIEGYFYSYWARSLAKTCIWIQKAAYLPDLNQACFNLPSFESPLATLQAIQASKVPQVPALPPNWTQSETRQQAWRNGLWQLRLHQLFGDNQNQGCF